MSQLEDDIYDDLYGDSTDLKSTTSQTPSPTEEKQEQPAPTASPARETSSVGTGENSLPAKPAPSTELSYSAQIAQQFSAYKQTPAQERQSQAHLAVSRSVGSGSDAVVLPQSPSQDESVARSRPVRPSEMKDEGKLFVGGLSWDTTDEGLRKYFSEFGKVEDCTILRDHDGRSRGFAFLTFEDPSSVNAVMVREHILDGKAIDPKRAIPREEHLRNTRYFVGGLSHASTSDSMRAFFSQYGKVVDCTVMVDRETGRSKGFGFVTFEDASNTDQLVGRVDLILDDKQIEVKVAQPRSQRDAARNGRTGRDGFDNSTGGMGYTSPPQAVNPQAMTLLYQRMMGQMPMMSGMPGMGMNTMGMGMGMGAGGAGMMPMGGAQMNDFGSMGGAGMSNAGMGNAGMGGNMGGGMNAGGMAGGMAGNAGGAINRGMGYMGAAMGGGMGGMGGMGAGMRMGMGPMGPNMGMMRPAMGMMAGGMMRPAMGMMGGMNPMARARGGAMVNTGVGPQRNAQRGQHGFHPYAR